MHARPPSDSPATAVDGLGCATVTACRSVKGTPVIRRWLTSDSASWDGVPRYASLDITSAVFTVEMIDGPRELNHLRTTGFFEDEGQNRRSIDDTLHSRAAAARRSAMNASTSDPSEVTCLARFTSEHPERLPAGAPRIGAFQTMFGCATDHRRKDSDTRDVIDGDRKGVCRQDHEVSVLAWNEGPDGVVHA